MLMVLAVKVIGGLDKELLDLGIICIKYQGNMRYIVCVRYKI
jgi:hypothetical protein